MSDVETFVLEYKVQSDKATRELAQVQKSVEGVNKTIQNSTQSLTRFVADLTGQLGSLSPAFSELASVIRGIGSAAGPAGLAMIALSEGIRAATLARDQFNEQRITGREAGMGQMRVEDVTRQLLGTKTGNVTRPAINDFLTRLQTLSREAGKDKTGLGPAALALSQVGLHGGMSTVDMLAALGGRWHGATDAQIQGEAGVRELGLNKDVSIALGKLGPGIAQPKMDTAEYEKTQAAVKDANVELSEFNENMNELSVTLGSYTLPAINTLLKALNRPAAGVAESAAEQGAAVAGGGAILPDVLADVVKEGRQNNDEERQRARRQIEQKALVDAAEQRMAQEQREKDYKKEDDANEAAQRLQTQQEFAISLFSQSVATFANAVISKEEALAIWAGTAGAAGGLSKTGYVATSPGQSGATVNMPPTSGAAGGTGATVGATNSRNNPGNIKVTPWSKAHGIQGEDGKVGTCATPEAGAQAMTDLLQGDVYKGKGFDTVSKIVTKWAPPSENDTAAYIRFVHDQTKLDVNTPLKPEDYPRVQQAMTRFEGSSSTPQSVAMNKHFKTPYTVQGGAAPVSTAGASVEGARLASVQAIVAERAHVDLRQLQQGRASRGDVEWAMTNQMNDYFLKEQQNKAQMAVPGLTDPIRQKLMKDQADTDVKISNLRDSWNYLLEHTRQGDRETTQGEYPVIINNTFNGYDSKQIWAELDSRLHSHNSAVANAGTGKMKR